MPGYLSVVKEPTRTDRAPLLRGFCELCFAFIPGLVRFRPQVSGHFGVVTRVSSRKELFLVGELLLEFCVPPPSPLTAAASPGFRVGQVCLGLEVLCSCLPVLLLRFPDPHTDPHECV